MQALETETTIEVNFSPLSRRYTLEEFWALPEREDHARYNLIGGYLFMVPPPNPPHGYVASRMTRSLVVFVDANNIEGDVHHPPEPIWLRAEGSTYLEPDMMYVSRELWKKMGDKRTSADIVFEYLSRSTKVYDQTTKADTYLALGVPELWLVDPWNTIIEVRHASKIGEILVWKAIKYSAGHVAKSRVLEGFEVSVDKLFEGMM
ncbi:MAG TPA: Uma2 family endonuclease [Pyrinomonadaceae bacterium]|jgi:Uma2 family endonuclease|nr:Uma2 family endonuclease [Pyrinomonadaceae bacterium]